MVQVDGQIEHVAAVSEQCVCSQEWPSRLMTQHAEHQQEEQRRVCRTVGHVLGQQEVEDAPRGAPLQLLW